MNQEEYLFIKKWIMKNYNKKMTEFKNENDIKKWNHQMALFNELLDSLTDEYENQKKAI